MKYFKQGHLTAVFIKHCQKMTRRHFRNAVFVSRYMEGVPFSIKGTLKGNLFFQNGIQKGKGLDLRVEPPRIKHL